VNLVQCSRKVSYVEYQLFDSAQFLPRTSLCHCDHLRIEGLI
jgi:hypothetical protein